VSEFLRNLQNNSRVLERPELVEIKVAAQGPQGVSRRVFDFSLNFTLKQTPERAQMQAQAGQPSIKAPSSSPVPTAVQQAPNLKSSAAPVAPEKK
jgi:hypothetical protein